MALIPHKEDQNYSDEIERYKRGNSEWGGDDLHKGMPPKRPIEEPKHPIEEPKKK